MRQVPAKYKAVSIKQLIQFLSFSCSERMHVCVKSLQLSAKRKRNATLSFPEVLETLAVTSEDLFLKFTFSPSCPSIPGIELKGHQGSCCGQRKDCQQHHQAGEWKHGPPSVQTA